MHSWIHAVRQDTREPSHGRHCRNQFDVDASLKLCALAEFQRLHIRVQKISKICASWNILSRALLQLISYVLDEHDLRLRVVQRCHAEGPRIFENSRSAGQMTPSNLPELHHRRKRCRQRLVRAGEGCHNFRWLFVNPMGAFMHAGSRANYTSWSKTENQVSPQLASD